MVFRYNCLKANPDKCHFLTNKIDDISINIKNESISSIKTQKRLGIKLNSMLRFEHGGAKSEKLAWGLFLGFFTLFLALFTSCEKTKKKLIFVPMYTYRIFFGTECGKNSK